MSAATRQDFFKQYFGLSSTTNQYTDPLKKTKLYKKLNEFPPDPEAVNRTDIREFRSKVEEQIQRATNKVAEKDRDEVLRRVRDFAKVYSKGMVVLEPPTFVEKVRKLLFRKYSEWRRRRRRRAGATPNLPQIPSSGLRQTTDRQLKLRL